MTLWCVQIGWRDTPHLSEDAKSGLANSYMPYERAARTEGVPSLGSGAIYPVPEEDILCDPFEFPAWYRFVYAADVGWNRTAALWGAIDPETDILYLYSEHYRGAAEPAVHAEAIKGRGSWIPGVIDPAARGRSQDDGESLLNQYRALGLNLIPADNRVESGIYAVWTRLSSGRIKVFKTLQNFRSEYRIYRRDEKGKIIKDQDHLMDDLRYMVMSGLSLAAQRPLDQAFAMLKVGQRGRHQVEYSPLASSWNPQPQQGSATGQPGRAPWMPHTPGYNR